MRIIIFWVMIGLLSGNSFGQQPNQKETKKRATQQPPSKKQMQGQLNEAIGEINKQIAELEKEIAVAKKEDPGSVKDLQAQVDLLKKQVSMMGGLSTTVSGISEETFREAGKEQPIVPKMDSGRISKIPRKGLTRAELAVFIKKIHAQVEIIIPAEEKKAAIEIYNQTLEKYDSIIEVANAASGCWMLGHWEKALYLMGRVCIVDSVNTDHLNNYASFLIPTGAEQAAIPILEYLKGLFPENSTILNNLGQAWFGLGDIDKSKKYLDSAIALYPNHSTANATLCNIARSKGDNDKAIAFLKSSLKENYDPEKEAMLLSLGYNITFDDMPEFNYPVYDDPLGISSLVELFPVKFPSHIGDDATVDDLNAFTNGARKLSEELTQNNRELQEKLRERSFKISGSSTFGQEFLEMHNSPAYKLASRSLALYNQELPELQDVSIISTFPGHLVLLAHGPFANKKKIVNDGEILKQCDSIWQNEVVKAIARIPYELPRLPKETTCKQMDDWTNSYYNRKAAIEQRGMEKIKRIYLKNKKELDRWIMLNMYAVPDEDNATRGQGKTEMLISHLETTIGRRLLENQLFLQFLDFGADLVAKHDYLRTQCFDHFTPKKELDETKTWLGPRPRRALPCEYIRTLKTPLVWYTAECNRLYKESKSKLEERKSQVQKGQSHSATRKNKNMNPGPLGKTGRGPFSPGFDVEFNTGFQLLAPLTAEEKDPSQCAVEFDKWGNLVGLNYQLNEEGQLFANADLPKEDIGRRWSWNAIASPTTGVLYKLAIKQK